MFSQFHSFQTTKHKRALQVAAPGTAHAASAKSVGVGSSIRRGWTPAEHMDARSSDEEYDFCYSDNLPSDSDDAPPPPTPSSRPGTASEARGSLLISSDDILHVVGARLVESEGAPHSFARLFCVDHSRV